MKNEKKIKLYGVFLILIASLVLFDSCRKNEDPVVTQTELFDNSEMTDASFVGQVIQEDGSPLENAMVSCGTHIMTTDEDGFFYFSDIRVPKKAALISVEKQGYFKAYRTVQVISDQDNQVQIMAMEKPQAVTFNASSGGSVSIPNGGSIKFDPNSIVDANSGQIYSGSVSVYAKWIDPSSDELFLQMPGDLRGINTEGAEEALVTYGMQAVELYSATGEKLQIADGNTAELKFPLPASFQSQSPASVPLWYFDESKAMWVEQGSAQKVGGEYVGRVSHFSFWNCDYGGPIVNFTCRLVDSGNNPIAGARVVLSPQNQNGVGFRSAFTNSNGEVSGGLPVNTTFDLSYVPPGCPYSSAPIFLQTFSAATSNVNLGNILAINNNTNIMVVTGMVEDCNGNTLSGAPVKLKIDQRITMVLTNSTGQFTININCATAGLNGLITAYDPSNSVNGTTQFTTISSGNINAGTLAACGMQNDYITYEVTIPPATSPTTYTIVNPSGTFYQYYSQSITHINGYDYNASSGPLFINFGFDGSQSTSGTHNLIYYNDQNDSSATFSPTPVNISQYGQVGDKISGSFSITANGLNYNNALINCDFLITRTQ